MQSDEETDEQSYIVKNLIEQSKVGSHIFVDTEIYLKLLVNQPCIKCGSIELIKKAHKASTLYMKLKLFRPFADLVEIGSK